MTSIDRAQGKLNHSTYKLIKILNKNVDRNCPKLCIQFLRRPMLDKNIICMVLKHGVNNMQGQIIKEGS